jgi:hypothetical protein
VDGEGFKAVPYHEAYRDDMWAVATTLEAAAAALKETEPALQAYLRAAAEGFRTNEWVGADRAWVAMSARNSRWYVRVGPDETGADPCAVKAGFGLQVARINPESLAWQDKLEPVKQELEDALARAGGPPYKARKVGFKLPDFIDVVLNSGDARPASGAILGQSLPNWGPVAESGGRTLVMTNLYSDPDSLDFLKAQMAMLYCQVTFQQASTDQRPLLASVVLHEAAHNLGPRADYLVKGKKPAELFGGPLAATLEELKAQTAALYFTPWLQTKGLLDETTAQQTRLRNVAWAFGHISRGMYSGSGKPQPYSQLAAIQLGTLLKEGALQWKAEQRAANGNDTGCFELDDARWPAAVDALARRAFRVKSRSDRAEAEALKQAFVDDTGQWKELREVIAQRWLRVPKAAFVYAVEL